ncbi:class I SAM-dependent methyltransferase [Dokdonella immobilis]|uniref:Predicted methyltransferase n=1 Tax=Dokdonella immobilis TaxID=578942 RepID=A0A1I4VUC2_9GAMM|nr:class I SAM-dependent methyltransferase [Dokdonella immobilis]SFN04596.1 Predicted methyltransferase [Dokdonella immobilis]
MPFARPLVLSLLLSMTCFTAIDAAPAPHPRPDPIAAAIANPARSDRDRERDARDRPEAVLKLAGFGPGMTIADIFGGGGYYSEILAGLVGPQGRVLLINNPPYDAYAKKALDARLAGGRLANVDYRIASNEAMDLGEGKLDGAMIIMSYHDLYVADPDQGWPAIDAGQFIDQIVKALKPGGKLLIVDHSARAGTGKSAAQTLHRIDETFAISDFEAHGLKWIAGSDVLRHKDDERTRNVTDEAIRGKTDRFVQVYRKP